jgi:hypothetical protein
VNKWEGGEEEEESEQIFEACSVPLSVDVYANEIGSLSTICITDPSPVHWFKKNQVYT